MYTSRAIWPGNSRSGKNSFTLKQAKANAIQLKKSFTGRYFIIIEDNTTGSLWFVGKGNRIKKIQ